MADNTNIVYDGECTCGAVKYRMTSKPMFVHCCHCSWCQRETGSAFVINAIIEADRVEIITGEVEKVDTPSASGKGQEITRCPDCKVAVWSHYSGLGATMSFVRVGTLKEPGRLSPDVHIYTSTKMPWVILPDGAAGFPEYYNRKELWSTDSLARRSAALAKKQA